jgi:hypothetical protein
VGFGSFVVAHFSDSEKLLPAVRLLAQRDDVLQWNAVDGNLHLVVKLKPSPSPSAPDPVLTIQGTDILTRYKILADYVKEEKIDPSLCHAYVFIETEANKSEAVLKSLREIEAVRYCSSVRSGSELIAFVQDRTFDALDRIISRTIRMLDGIVRLKVNRVIELRAM